MKIFKSVSAVLAITAFMASHQAQAAFEWRPLNETPPAPQAEMRGAIDDGVSVSAPAVSDSVIIDQSPLVDLDGVYLRSSDMNTPPVSYNSQAPVAVDLNDIPADALLQSPSSSVAVRPSVEINEPVSAVSSAPASSKPLNLFGMQASSSNAAPIATQSANGGVVDGFGENIPLIIALRQIVPANYEFNYGEGVDMGALVTWKGGQNWKSTVDNTLAPLGMNASVSGNVVNISKNNQRSASFPTAPESAEAALNYTPSVIEDRSMNTELQVREVSSVQAVPPVVSERDMASQNKVLGVKGVMRKNEPQAVSFALPEKDENADRVWYGTNGTMLSDVIRNWAQKANVELHWESQFDYPLKATVVVEGKFEDAVKKLLEGFDQADPRPVGRLHKNSSLGPSVLIIEEQSLIQ